MWRIAVIRPGDVSDGNAGRKRPVISRRFRSASATKFWCRSAVDREGRQTTHS